MHSYFISDLHLTPERPDISQAFMQFLLGSAGSADQVYILGDLFEYWIGDDAASMIGAEPALQAMQQLSAKADCFFIAGNRDFLVGEQFMRETGFKILVDETVVDLYGQPTLLLHGDSLCTDDIAHQQFRAEVVNNTERKAQFLSLAIADRIEQAKSARMQSQQHKSAVSMEIMDVSESAVLEAFNKFDVQSMIHGHTHRQKTHHYSMGGKQLTRYVLGDWSKTSSIMTVNADDIKIDNQPI